MAAIVVTVNNPSDAARRDEAVLKVENPGADQDQHCQNGARHGPVTAPTNPASSHGKSRRVGSVGLASAETLLMGSGSSAARSRTIHLSCLIVI